MGVGDYYVFQSPFKVLLENKHYINIKRQEFQLLVKIENGIRTIRRGG